MIERTFKVFDNNTGEEADPSDITLHEEWAKNLVYCDMEGFALLEDGTLILLDECGNFVYCSPERFEVRWDEDDNLINRESALETVKNTCSVLMLNCSNHYDSEVEDTVYDDIKEVDAILKCNKHICKALKKLPTAPSNIIRCKDCKFYTKMRTDTKYGICSLASRHLGDDGYCSEAEERRK